MWKANDGRPAWIACMGRCAVLISKAHKTDAEAIAAWNTRTPDPAVQALVEAAKRVSFNYHHGNGLEGLWAAYDNLDAALAAFDET